MTPREFWWLYEFKYPKKSKNGLDVAELKRVLDLPEARPSIVKKVHNGS